MAGRLESVVKPDVEDSKEEDERLLVSWADSVSDAIEICEKVENIVRL